MLVSQTAIFVVRPVLTYRAIELGVSDASVGLLVVAYAFIPAFSASWLGRYSDRRRPAPVLRVGLAALAGSCIMIVLAPSFLMLLVASTVMGFGALAVMAACQSLVGRLTRDSAMDRDFGLISAAASVGQMTGPAIGGLLLDGPGGRADGMVIAFISAAIACGIAVFMASRFGDRPRAAVGDATPGSLSWGRLVRLPGVAPGMFASLALLGAVDLLVAFLPLIGEQRGIAPLVVGALLSARAAASVASRLLLGWLIARWSRGGLLTLSTLVSGAVLAVVPLLPEVWMIGAALVVAGFFLGIGQPLTMSLVANAVPEGERGSALAMRIAVNKVGQVAVALGVSAVTGLVGAGLGFVSIGGILLCASATLHLRRRKA